MLQLFSRVTNFFVDQRRYVSWSVLLVGLSLCTWGWTAYSSLNENRAHLELENELGGNNFIIEKQLARYKDLLWSARSFAEMTSDPMQSLLWSDYVARLRIEEHYPGILGLGFIAVVTPNSAASFETRLESEYGFPFLIHPPRLNDSTFDSYVTQNIEPLAKNAVTLGYDLGSDPDNRATAERARDLGDAQMTKKFELVPQDRKTMGFFIVLPVYRGTEVPDTIADRRIKLRGWVFEPVMFSDFLRWVPEGLSYNIYEGDSANAKDLAYSQGTVGSDNTFETRIEFGGQRWLIVWHPNKLQNSGAGYLTLVLGVIISFLLFALTSVLTKMGTQAQKLAFEKDSELKKNEARIKLLMEVIIEPIFGIDSKGQVSFANETCIRGLGYQSIFEIIGKDAHQIIAHGEGEECPGISCRAKTVFATAKKLSGHDLYFYKKDSSQFLCEYWTHPIVKRGHLKGSIVRFKEYKAQTTLPMQNISVKSLIDGTVALTESIFRDHDVVLKLPDIDSGIMMQCRAPQISQVLVNFLTRGLESAKLSDQKWVRIEFKELGNWLEFAVTDSSSQPPEELQPKLKGDEEYAKAHNGVLEVDTDSAYSRCILLLPKKQSQNENAA